MIGERAREASWDGRSRTRQRRRASSGNALRGARRAVFFGGAGVSTASGIPDFRSADGLYHQHFAYPPEEMLGHDFFVSHTAEFYDFYRERMICLAARPNRAHVKLAELEAEGHLAAVVTQNIDGLHQMAGSRVVHELHGSVHRNVCTRCGGDLLGGVGARDRGRTTVREMRRPREAGRGALRGAARRARASRQHAGDRRGGPARDRGDVARGVPGSGGSSTASAETSSRS